MDYDPAWPAVFDRLRDQVWPVVQDIAISIEHIGSTSVPGLASKSIIDLSIVTPSDAEVPLTIERLVTLGYIHRGNLGIEGREAFKQPDGLPRHHLYLCPQSSLGLKNPLALRDYLRTHPDIAQAYGDLKKTACRPIPSRYRQLCRRQDGFHSGDTAATGIFSRAVRRNRSSKSYPEVRLELKRVKSEEYRRSLCITLPLHYCTLPYLLYYSSRFNSVLSLIRRIVCRL